MSYNPRTDPNYYSKRNRSARRRIDSNVLMYDDMLDSAYRMWDRSKLIRKLFPHRDSFAVNAHDVGMIIAFQDEAIWTAIHKKDEKGKK
jgi:hypothetical protein